MFQKKIAIVGLGYVGLPLAVEFAKQYETFGIDIEDKRVKEIQAFKDITNELSEEELREAKYLKCTTNFDVIRDCDFVIVTVPTPIDESKNPDLRPIMNASKAISSRLKKGTIVIFESTVYPGTTEEVCVPLLEDGSNLKFNRDFFCGYSPERINPGDKLHRLPDIMKVTSGSTDEITNTVDALYRSIITAGTYKATSIKVAEAAKVIENTQRDLNIGLMNELSKIFDKLGIDTLEVLEAAGTKWNFMPYRPGLVGGHCIGVDPYYLTFKAQSAGYNPEIILSARRLNDSMHIYAAEKLIKAMIKKDIKVNKAKVLFLGHTFKENCPDTRNSKVFDLRDAICDYGVEVTLLDPYAEREKNYTKISDLPSAHFSAVLIAVPHQEFLDAGIQAIKRCLKDNNVIFDLKSAFDKRLTDIRL